MWIKHNNSVFNSANIKKIYVEKNYIYGLTASDEPFILGKFKTQKRAKEIFSNLTQQLLFEDSEHPGVIIRDDKEVN